MKIKYYVVYKFSLILKVKILPRERNLKSSKNN